MERGIYPASTFAIHHATKIFSDVGKRAVKRTEVRAPGNPSEKTDFFIEPKTNEVYDFIRFARTEGRFAKHFDKDGNPSETLIKAKQERLANWRTLQELAGII
jgi:pyruvate ferredoxin oxidoreductase beta subunit